MPRAVPAFVPTKPRAPRDLTDSFPVLTMGMDWQPDAVVLMLAVYLDETGDDTTYLVGGLMATVERWEALADEWNRILSRDPRLSHWHQADAYAHKKSPWIELGIEHYKQFVADLAAAIVAANPWGISVSLRAEDWNVVVPKKPNIERRPDTISIRHAAVNHYASPYSILCAGIGKAISMRLVDIASTDRVMVVMENSTSPGTEAVVDCATWMLGNDLDRYESITVENGKSPETRPLEAADMYMWALRRYMTKGDRALWSLFESRIAHADSPISQDTIRQWWDAIPRER